MDIGNILESTSFSALPDCEQKAVRSLFDDMYKSGEPFSLDHLTIFRHRQSLTVLLHHFGKKLDQINPATFRYLQPLQNKLIENELLFAFYIFSAQYQLDEFEDRHQYLKNRSEQLKACAKLIDELRHSSSVFDESTTKRQLDTAPSDSEKHLKYLGLTAEKIVKLSSTSTTEAIKTWMSEVNGKRLQWVWVNALLSSVLSMIPEDFAGSHQASDAISAPSPVTGYMSWVLYYARFAINFGLLLKHTIENPWMSKKESQIPPWERFIAQWDQRKFSLLNDSIWATANMLCFFWLVGYFGNVLTTILLAMDTSFGAWGLWEETRQHKKDIKRYQDDIAELQNKIKKELDPYIEKALEALEKAKKQCELDWKYKEYGLINDLVYAALLLVAFIIMCCFLVPPAALAPATAMILGVAGAAMCFIFTTVAAAVKGSIEIAKTKEYRQLAIDELKGNYQLFQNSDNENVKKQLFLDMKQLKCTTDYQARVVSFQKIHLLRAVIIDAMVPSLVFVSFMFLPFGIGLAVLAAGFTIALLSNMILQGFEPQAENLPVFDEKEYDQFLIDEQFTKKEKKLLSTPHFFFHKAIGDSAIETKGQQGWTPSDNKSFHAQQGL